MKKGMWACALNGIMLGAVKLFYELTPIPMANLLYCTFLGFTVTFAVGAEVKKTGRFLGSLAIGLVWAAGYVGVETVFLDFPLPEIAAKALAFGLMSFIIEAGNCMILSKTKFNIVPLQFAVVIGIFSQQCRHIPYILGALLIGMTVAVISKQIYGCLLTDATENKRF